MVDRTVKKDPELLFGSKFQSNKFNDPIIRGAKKQLSICSPFAVDLIDFVQKAAWENFYLSILFTVDGKVIVEGILYWNDFIHI